MAFVFDVGSTCLVLLGVVMINTFMYFMLRFTLWFLVLCGVICMITARPNKRAADAVEKLKEVLKPVNNHDDLKTAETFGFGYGSHSGSSGGHSGGYGHGWGGGWGGGHGGGWGRHSGSNEFFG